MNLLHAIYASPSQLLDKAKRDGRALTEALRVCDEAAVRDSVFDFALSAYHITDWIKAYRPELKDAVSDLLDASDSIGACRDLCNASKHVILTLDRGPYLNHPPVVDAVTISATAKTSLDEVKRAIEYVRGPDAGQKLSPAWRLKIQLKNGRRVAAEDLVAEAIDVWEKFFVDYHVQ